MVLKEFENDVSNARSMVCTIIGFIHVIKLQQTDTSAIMEKNITVQFLNVFLKSIA